MRESSRIYQRLLRGEATAKEYTDAVGREVRRDMPRIFAGLKRSIDRLQPSRKSTERSGDGS